MFSERFENVRKNALNIYPYGKKILQLTLHDVDDGADVALLDDEGAADVLHGVHAVHDLLDLGRLEVLHEIVVHDHALDEGAGPGAKIERKYAVRNCSWTTI